MGRKDDLLPRALAKKDDTCTHFVAVFTAELAATLPQGPAERFRAHFPHSPCVAVDFARVISAVFTAQSLCARTGGASFPRARLLDVCRAEPSRFDFVRATMHPAHVRHVFFFLF